MRVRTIVTVGVTLSALAILGVAVVLSLGRVGSPGGGAGAVSLAAPHFVEESLQAGLAHAYEGGFDYYVGGGVAAFDCNEDLLPELYLAGGSGSASLFVNRSATGGSLRFEAVASPVTDLEAVTGAYPIDLDGDGLVDLALLRRGENVLLRGRGDCTFERANEEWTFDGGDEWSTAFSAKWDPGAAWPTIAVGNYLAPAAASGQRSCEDNDLFQPAPNGGAFGSPIALTPSWCSLSILFSDWDRSGRRDLRVSNDRHYYTDYSDGAEQLWRTAPGEDVREYTEADGWQRVRVFGMGIGAYDVTGDGHPDYYLTSQADNKLQTLADGADAPRYEDIALRLGVTAQRPVLGDTTMPSTSWHAEFQDVNNDGLADLFVTKGNVEAMPEFAARDPSNLFVGQPDGSFEEVSADAGVVDYGRARGAVIVDLNRDGLLDIVVARRVQNVLAYRNVGSGSADQPTAMGSWVALDLGMDGANRDAVGAWIEVRVGDHVMQRELTVGGGHISGEMVPVHFGLGGANGADVRITWPDGTRSDWQRVSANRTYRILPGVAPTEVVAP